MKDKMIIGLGQWPREFVDKQDVSRNRMKQNIVPSINFRIAEFTVRKRA